MITKSLKDYKILVTPTSFARYNKNLTKELEDTVGSVIYNNSGKPLNEKDLIPLIWDVDGYIAGLDEVNSTVIGSAKKLKVIARYGTGVDRVDLSAAKRAGIYVTNTPGANSVSVAELTIGLAIASSRNITEADQKTKEGNWPRMSGLSMSGKTFGIVGFGSIGKEVAKRISNFNVKIIAYDINFDSEFAERYNVNYSSLNNLFSISDFVSLHIPVTKDTIDIINKKSLSIIKKGAIIINTARGELIDEDALYESLISGQLRAAALDVFKKEPPDLKDRLLSLKQVIITPHIGAATDNASNEMTRISIEECLAVLSGKKPMNIVIEP